MTWKLEGQGTAKEEAMSKATMESLVRRLDRVERENQRFKRAGKVKVGDG